MHVRHPRNWGQRPESSAAWLLQKMQWAAACHSALLLQLGKRAKVESVPEHASAQKGLAEVEEFGGVLF